MSETPLNVYETCDPAYLQQLREQVGMDVVQLARTACLSVAQVKSLEDGEDDLFYSQAIRRQAYKRILTILGAPPPLVMAAADQETISQTAVASVNPSLDLIADLRTQPVDGWPSPKVGAPESQTKWSMLALAIGVVVVGWVAADLTGMETPMTLASFQLSESTTVSSSGPLNKSPIADSEAVKNMAAVTPTPTSAAPAPATTSASALAIPATDLAMRGKSDCSFSSNPGPEVTPAAPKKEGRFVYVLSPSDTTLCLVDGSKQVNNLQLKAGEGRSVYGTAPWQLSGSQLAQIQIYFQGWRVNLPEGAAQKIVLVEKALAP